MSHLTTITLSMDDFAMLLVNLRKVENFALDIDEPAIAECLYQMRLMLLTNSDNEGAIASHNPTLDL